MLPAWCLHGLFKLDNVVDPHASQRYSPLLSLMIDGQPHFPNHAHQGNTISVMATIKENCSRLLTNAGAIEHTAPDTRQDDTVCVF